MSNKIRIRKPQDTEVYIKDPDADPESEKHLMFVVKPAVRSARREVNEIAVKIVAAFEKLSDAEGAEQLALEETIVRLRCDQINALVTIVLLISIALTVLVGMRLNPADERNDE